MVSSTSLADFFYDEKKWNAGTTKPIKKWQTTSLEITHATIDKPWMLKREPKKRRTSLFFWAAILFFVAIRAALIYVTYRNIDTVGNICLVLNETWDGDIIDTNTWGYEVRLGDSFGRGEFEMTTNSSKNSFVENGVLYIVPTLTSDEIGTDAIFNGYTYNVTGCSVNSTASPWACSAASNSSTETVINPVQSARLTTINSTSIRYGKVQVVAKLPKGDWLWPSITMHPVYDIYGGNLTGGEIDVRAASVFCASLTYCISRSCLRGATTTPIPTAAVIGSRAPSSGLRSQV